MTGPGDRTSFRVVTWNVEWKPAGSRAADLLLERIFDVAPDAVCLTEAPTDFFGGTGHVITADPDYGYGARGKRRKVLLWSKSPWINVDQIGDPSLPPGRFVCAETETPIGHVRFVGVCVPWSGAHVTTGRQDRRRWDDHLTYLDGLARVSPDWCEATVLLGDFNQAIPRRTAPRLVYKALERALGDHLSVATTGLIEPIKECAIDHVAHTRELTATSVESLSPVGDRGERLSDHFGLAVTIEIGEPVRRNALGGGSF